MRYTLSELQEDKKLRKTMADLAERKELAFEDGNGVFALDFQSRSLRLNHRYTFDRLYELGGEKLLKKLIREKSTCLSVDRNAANQSVCAVRGTENYFLLLNAGSSKAFSSILSGIAAWAKLDKSFDAALVTFSDEVEDSTEDEDVAVFGEMDFDFEENGWLCQGEKYSCFNLDPVQNGVLAEKDGKPVFVDGKTGKPLFISQLLRQGEMVSCEPLYEDNDENRPLMGYKYQTEADGKWGFISPRLVRVTLPEYDEILVTDQELLERAGGLVYEPSMVAAWKETGENTVDLSFSVQATQEKTGVQDVWLLPGPAFEGVASYYTPTTNAAMDTQTLEDGCTVTLYKPSSRLNFGLFKKSYGYESELRSVEYKDGFISVFLQDGKVAANDLTLEKCLQLDKGERGELRLSACVAEPGENSVGTYIIRKDGYWALADVDVSGEPRVEHLSTPLAYTSMAAPENWRNGWLMVERFGKKGIYDWLQEEFVVSCEYEEISLDKKLRQYVLVRHGNERRMTELGTWVEEAKPACPKCRTQLVQGALYCHMCGVSLVEPEKKAEPKTEPAQEAPKAESKAESKPSKEAPKPVVAAPPAKPAIKVPTKSNFKDNYVDMGRTSGVINGQLRVTTRFNDKDYEDTNPNHFLYGEQTIYHYKNRSRGGVVGDLSHLAAYALGDNGIFYAKNDEIWYWSADGNRRKLGQQKNVIKLNDEGNGKLTVEYVEKLSGGYSDYRDGDYYEEWYNVYDVTTRKVTLNY